MGSSIPNWSGQVQQTKTDMQNFLHMLENATSGYWTGGAQAAFDTVSGDLATLLNRTDLPPSVRDNLLQAKKQLLEIDIDDKSPSAHLKWVEHIDMANDDLNYIPSAE